MGGAADAQRTVGAFFGEGAGATDRRPAPLTQRDKLRSSPWPHPIRAQPKPLWEHTGQRERGQAQALPEPGGGGRYGKSAALEGPSKEISTLNLLFGGQVPKSPRKHGLGQEEGHEPSQERSSVLLAKAG